MISPLLDPDPGAHRMRIRIRNTAYSYRRGKFANETYSCKQSMSLSLSRASMKEELAACGDIAPPPSLHGRQLGKDRAQSSVRGGGIRANFGVQ
jgi:hypothetical protein